MGTNEASHLERRSESTPGRLDEATRRAPDKRLPESVEDAIVAALMKDEESIEDATQFLNVDLDVFSREPLDALAAALDETVSTNYVGARSWNVRVPFVSWQLWPVRRPHHPRLVPSGHGVTWNHPARIWDNAVRREFNIGIQVGVRPYSHEIGVSSETLASVAQLGGAIVVTTYAPRFPSLGIGTKTTRKK